MNDELNIVEGTVLAIREFPPHSNVVKSHYDHIHTRNIAKVVKSRVSNISINDIILFKNNNERDMYYNGIEYIVLVEEDIYGKINN